MAEPAKFWHPLPYFSGFLRALLSRGQQIKILSMILRRCRQDGFVEMQAGDAQGGAAYEEAIVIESRR